jgi:hypothetical protein
MPVIFHLPPCSWAFRWTGAVPAVVFFVSVRVEVWSTKTITFASSPLSMITATRVTLHVTIIFCFGARRRLPRSRQKRLLLCDRTSRTLSAGVSGLLVGSMKEVTLLAGCLRPEERVLALTGAQGEGFGALACTSQRRCRPWRCT